MAATKNTKAFYNTEIPSDWKIKKLGALVEIVSGVSPSLFNLDVVGKYPYLKVEDLNNCEKYQVSSREFSNDEKQLVPKNSVIFPKRGAAILNNKVRINSVAVQMDSNLMAVYPKSEDLNFEYLYYQITFEQLHKIADTSTIPQINNKHIIPYSFPLPPLPEQKAIALVLSTADTAIHTTEKLIAQKALRKKWLMQQLLTGKKRLKGFCEEWKEKKLGKLFNQIKNVNDGDDTHSIMTISSKLGLISQEDKFDRVIAGDSLKKYTQLVKGDFAYNKGNSKTYPMGCIYRLEEKESALVPFVYICFSPSDLVDGLFYKHWFSAHGLDKQLNKIITSGARGDGLLNVNTDDFFGLKIIFPPKEEQTAIAQVLQAADKEISLLKAKAEKLREQKKGLMQVLLTGKIRLNYDSSDFYDSNENK
jgi:type I restriction enzyme S subunit